MGEIYQKSLCHTMPRSQPPVLGVQPYERGYVPKMSKLWCSLRAVKDKKIQTSFKVTLSQMEACLALKFVSDLSDQSPSSYFLAGSVILAYIFLQICPSLQLYLIQSCFDKYALQTYYYFSTYFSQSSTSILHLIFIILDSSHPRLFVLHVPKTRNWVTKGKMCERRWHE